MDMVDTVMLSVVLSLMVVDIRVWSMDSDTVIQYEQ